MITNHTPGPWKVHNPSVDSLAVSIGSTGRNDFEWPTNYTPRDLANARLIAAAPELLESLEALLKNAENKAVYISMLENTERFDSEGNAIAEYSHEMDKARAAIAKAKGHQ